MVNAVRPHDDLAALLAAAEASREQGAPGRGAALAADAAVLAEARGLAMQAAQARALLALHQVRLGEVEKAVASALRALAHLAGRGPSAELSRAHDTLSAAYERAGLNTLAVTHAAQALEAARACGDARAECWALNRLGTALDDTEGSHRGLEMLAQAVALARSLPGHDALFAALNNLSRRWVVEADRLAALGSDARPALLQALPLADEALRLAEPTGLHFATATAAANLAGVYRRLGLQPMARQHFDQALAVARRQGYAGLAATLALALASLDAEEQPSAATRQALQQLLDSAAPATDPDLRLQARRALVQCCRACGDWPAALAQMEQLHAEDVASRARRSDLQSRLLFNQAELDQARHAAERARLDAELQRLRADAEHRAAQQLALDRDMLEREVAARTADLHRAKTEAESASRAKSAFLSIVSHELRTPLHGVLGMLELARRRAVEPRQIDQLGKAAEAARQLNGLIDGVLHYVAADAQPPGPALANGLQPLLDGLLQPRQAAAQARGLVLQLEVDARLPDAVVVDAPRLARILEALLDNALKFSVPGQVRLVARRLAMASGRERLRLEVIDQGPGLSPDLLERLFRPFELGDASASRPHGGLGLGLALAHRLAQGLGAEVGVDSRHPEEGSLFWVSLPLVAAGAAGVAPGGVPGSVERANGARP